MDNLVIGQRYMSIAEPELGLGVLTSIEEKTVVITYPGCDEIRRYGKKTAPLKRFKFEIGDEITSNDLSKFIVEKIIEDSAGLLIYLGKDETQIVHECDLLDSINFHRPEEKLLNITPDSQELFKLRIDSLKHKAFLAKYPYVGMIGPRINLIHHQLYLVNEICKRMHPRVLLADEVGLGKTIEAGMILHKLLNTKRIERVLIVLPNPLCYQWFIELYRKYNLSFSVLVEESDLMDSKNPFDENNLIITSIDFICENNHAFELIKDSHFDLLIVDEAHRLDYKKGVASLAYERIELLSRKIKSLLLLTATPEMFGLEGHFARLKLIDSSFFYDFEKFKEEHDHTSELARIAKKISLEEKLESSELSLLEKQNLTDISNPKVVLKELIDRHNTGRVYFRNTRKIMNQTYNFFPKRNVFDVLLDDSNSSKASFQNFDPMDNEIDSKMYQLKILWLIDFLNEKGNEKVLLICKSKNKILKIEQDLKEHSVNNKIALFHSDLSLLARDRQAAYFQDPDGANILVCSEIGSEGRNFEFASNLVLFDLPLTPDLLEQRIGRLDRIGQKNDISIYIPYVKNSYEEILFKIYHEALDAFRTTQNGTMKVMEEFRSQILKALMNTKEYLLTNKELLNDLIKNLIEFFKEVKLDLEKGHDILIELNSFDESESKNIVAQIKDTDQSKELQNYLESVFSNFGVDIEDLGNESYFIRPGDNMFIPSFPFLSPDGLSYTVNRQLALEKEELTFMTWDHPMVISIIEMICGDVYGNAAVVTRKNFTAPKPYIELFFQLSCVAPKELEVGRFLTPKLIRVLLNMEAQNFSDKFTKEMLDELLVNASTEVKIAVSKIGKSKLLSLFAKGQEIAQEELKQKISQSIQETNDILNYEIFRLENLLKVNPLVSKREIELLKIKQEEIISFIEQTNLNLDSFRFIY